MGIDRGAVVEALGSACIAAAKAAESATVCARAGDRNPATAQIYAAAARDLAHAVAHMSGQGAGR